MSEQANLQRKVAMDRMACAYELQETARAIEQMEATADAFRPDDRFERLLELRRSSPEQFERMSSSVKISVGHYADQRRIHTAVQGMRAVEGAEKR